MYDHEIIPSKFNIYCKDRKSRGGGVLVAVSESLQSSIIPSPENLELISVSITHRDTIIICTVYYLNSLFLYLSNLITLHDHISLVGDFNFPDINWDTLSGSYLQNPSVILFFQNNLSQLVHSPTHLKGNILDLILTNSDELLSNVEVIPPHHSLSSDHYIISFQLSLLKSVTPRQKPRYVFDFPKANLTGLCNFLLDFDFSPCLASVNIEYVWSAIKQAIYTGMDLFIPKVRIRSHQYPIWFTPELRHLSKCIEPLPGDALQPTHLTLLINFRA